MNDDTLLSIVEAAIFVAGAPVSLTQLSALFPHDQRPSHNQLRQIIALIQQAYADRAVELKEVASGYQFQSKIAYAPWLQCLWEEKPARYSRALLETLALIAYRQPVTRAEIENIRGVAVSSAIMRTLLEREWIQVVGYRDLPGRPSLYATTKKFLDYFNLTALSELPVLPESNDWFDTENRIAARLQVDGSSEAIQSVALPHAELPDHLTVTAVINQHEPRDSIINDRSETSS